jgi:thiol-disulfide isomerase/thioredoxin
MKFFVLLTGILFSCGVFAQQDTTPPYKRFPNIPPFDLLQTDSSTHLTKESISKKHPVLLLYFSPDCPHCKHQTEEILAEMDKFKDIEIVMATYQPFEEMVTFYHNYKISSYPNIKMGRDTRFMLPPYFRMRNLPYLALYSRKGALITTFDGNQKVATLLEAFEGKEK